jgi:hypothetical protein
VPSTPLRRGRRAAVRGLAAASAGLAAVLWLGAPASASTSTDATGTTPASGPVVLLGTSGVRWSDVSAAATPALATLAGHAAVANAAVRSVRAVSCPADGWLAVSTGTRAADVEQPDGSCRPLTDPQAGSAVPGWSDYRTAAAADGYDARPGLLGDLLAAAGTSVRGLGPGAAIATARTDGRPVGDWSPLPETEAGLDQAVAQALTGGSQLVVVDLGDVRNRADLTRVDRRVQAALAGVDGSGVRPTVLVTSLADRGSTPQLQLATISGPGIGATFATSSSTRQDGLVVGTDIVATVADRLGLADVDRSGLVGAPIRATDRAPGDRLGALVDVALHASVARPLVPSFYLALVVLNVALYAVIAFGLARGPGRSARSERHRRRTLRWLQLVALGVGAVPVGLLLANLAPWWRAAEPAAALAVVTLAVVGLVVGLALAVPWRRSVLGSAGTVAAVTAAVILVDIGTGARLQLSAVIGAPTLAAGRFYGFNNTAFALATASTLLGVSALVDPWVRAGRRLAAAGTVAAVGIGLTVLDGTPEIGADFGGPPALIPAFTALVLLIAGARLTWRRVATVLGGAVAVAAAFALADWTRPADRRTHLGALVQTVLDGGLWPVVARKASANLHIIANNRPLTVLTLVAVAFVLAALWRPLRAMVLSPDGGRYGWLSHGTALNAITRAAPTLAPCLVATATALVIGFAVNDSGIAIPALGVTITVPLLVAACAAWLLTLDRPPSGPVADPPAGAGAAGVPAVDPPRRTATDEAGRPGPAATAERRAVAGPRRPRPSRGSGRQLRWRIAALPVLGLVALAVVAGAGPATAASTPEPAPSATGSAPSTAGSTAPVVLVGVTGLRWSDVSALSTPTLWRLSRTAAVGQAVVRSVRSRACPVDGWLAVSAGQRAADEGMASGCRTVPEPSAATGTAQVLQWPDYQASVATQPYDARLGLLGDLVRAHAVTATAIGPGAAIALADADGVVAGTYASRPEVRRQLTTAVRTALAGSRLVVVDAGTLRDPGYVTTEPTASPSPTSSDLEPSPEVTLPPGADAILEPDRAEQAQQIDERLGAVLAATADTGATVLVVSLADSGTTALQLAAVSGPLPGADGDAHGLLTSASTQQTGLLQVTDVLPTLLAGLGLGTDPAAADLPGATITSVAGPATANARLAALADADRLAVQITRVSGGFTVRFLLAQVLLALVAAVLLHWSAIGHWAPPGRAALRPALRALEIAAVVMAATPVAAFLTRTVPWWRSSVPRATFWLVLGGWALAVAALALLGPWRRSRTGPLTVIAAVTTAVLAVDAALGGRLVVDSPLGAHRLLGARFYGVSNQAFALLGVAGLIVAAAAARALLARGRRTTAWLAVTGVGLVVLVVDGMPGMGSDFGGPPALLPAFALLGFVVAGRRVRWRTVLVVLAAAAVVVLGFAVVDYLRPAADRTHLGRFVATAVAGGLAPVIDRKLGTNLRLLSSARYVLPTLAGTALTVLVTGGPGRFGPPRLPRGELAGLTADEPLLRPTAVAIAVAMALGFAVNDSGVVIPATGLALAVPCLVALAARWRLARLSPGAAASTPPATTPPRSAADGS